MLDLLEILQRLDMMHPSPQHREDLQQIQHVEKHLRDENPAHREFRIITVPDRDVRRLKHHLSYHSSEVHRSFAIRTSHPTDVGIQYGDKNDCFSEGLLESGCGRNGEGRRNLCTVESKDVPNIAPFGKGNDVGDHMSLTHTLRDEKWACGSRIWCSSDNTECHWMSSLGI